MATLRIFLSFWRIINGHNLRDPLRRWPAQRVVVGAVSTPIGVFAPVEMTVHESPIALLIPPDLPIPAGGRPLPTTPLAPPRVPEPAAPDLGPIIIGVAAVDGSGRVRERTLFAALGWRRGESLDLHVVHNAAVLQPVPHGSVRIDGRDQLALPSGCRTVLGIRPGDRVVLAALPNHGILLVYPMSLATCWIRAHAVELPEVLNA